ncbi:hypothetical protein ACJIZ3_024019 [Penstemon smallii]|uniref:Uncharacterized protein n=1 Tax=Penstemon smallii TaxID=265156 RepID=A0ABD3TT52_9LAMI
MATHPPDAIVGITNVTLFTDATTRLPLPALQLGHGLIPNPIAKNRDRSIFCGTFAGYFLEFKLLSEFVKLFAIGVAFRGGGIVSCNVAVAVLLSTATICVSMKGDAVTMYFPTRLSAVIRTLVVCPGAIMTVSILKGFTYVASTSTTVRYGTPSLGKMTSAPWTVDRNHRICACHRSVPLWPVIVKLYT